MPDTAISPDTVLVSEAKRRLLEQYLRSVSAAQSAVPVSIPRRGADGPAPLSCSQEQVWLHAQMAPDVPLYNEPVTIHYHGDLDTGALERSFNEILRRHEAWRTCFPVADGQPVQFIEPALTVSLPVTDRRHLPKEQREAEALRLATQDAQRPLDLARAPLFRARLVRLDDCEYRLFLVLCHIIFDGVAIYRVFLPELAALYKAFAAGKPSPLPELPVQFADYACHQRQGTRTVWTRAPGLWAALQRGINWNGQSAWQKGTTLTTEVLPSLPGLDASSSVRLTARREDRGGQLTWMFLPGGLFAALALALQLTPGTPGLVAGILAGVGAITTAIVAPAVRGRYRQRLRDLKVALERVLDRVGSGPGAGP